MRHSAAPRTGRGRARVVVAVLAVVCLLVVPGAGAVVGPGWQARDHLVSAARLARQLHQQLAAGDVAQARETLTALQDQAGAARDATSGLGWRLGRRLPWLGANFAATGTAAAIVDDLAREGLPPVVEAAADLDPAALAPLGGRLDLAPLQRAAPRMAAADQAVRAARDRAAAIGTGGLVPPVRSAITLLQRELDRAARTVAAAARVTTLAPPMLGANGPRTYLVLFQNPAEIRATGGMPGAFAVVRADRGRLRIVEQGTAAADLKSFERPVLPLDPGMRALYTDRLGTYPANVNLTPHFPTAAALAREMYRLRSGYTVDGVLATDPIALSYLLRATGPVRPAGGPALTAANAVPTLLSDVYEQPGGTQDAYFAAAAAAAFDALVGGAANPRTALTELARAAGERRVLLWSAHESEQQLIAGTVLAGELPADDGMRPTVGVFLNDGSGAKLGYYLTQSVRLEVTGCRADGRRELRVRVGLGSTAPASGLPAPVLGMGLAGDPYTIRTNVSVFSPARGRLVGMRLDGVPVPAGTGLERGRMVGLLTVDLPPGGHRVIEADLLTAPLPTNLGGPAAAPDIWLTPAVRTWHRDSHSSLVCPG
jgi:uncharacterized protein DUF4012